MLACAGAGGDSDSTGGPAASISGSATGSKAATPVGRGLGNRAVRTSITSPPSITGVA